MRMTIAGSSVRACEVAFVQISTAPVNGSGARETLAGIDAHFDFNTTPASPLLNSETELLITN